MPGEIVPSASPDRSPPARGTPMLPTLQIFSWRVRRLLKRRKWLRLVVPRVCLALIAGFALTGRLEARGDLRGPMRFSAHQTCTEDGCARYILAEGVITQGIAEEFRAFMREQELSRVPVYFNSPGGNLHGGVLLGAAIRDLELDTRVGGAYVEQSGPSEPPRVLASAPQCLSACIYAFAGGVSRAYLQPGKLADHPFFNRFDSSNRITESGELSARRTTQMLARYLERMGVSPQLLEHAATGTRTSLREITPAEARKFNLTNAGSP